LHRTFYLLRKNIADTAQAKDIKDKVFNHLRVKGNVIAKKMRASVVKK
jgi:hypothetical protein